MKRRRTWLTAGLYHLGDKGDFAAEDVLQKFILERIPQVCANYRSNRGTFQAYLNDAFRYFCWRQRKRERTSTPAGRLQLHLLAAVAQFERERIVERVKAGLDRARTQGKRLGRPRAPLPLERLLTVAHLSLTDAAEALGVSRATIKRWRKAQKTLSPAA